MDHPTSWKCSIPDTGAKVKTTIRKSHHDGYVGFLTIIDVATSYLWTHPIKSKEPLLPPMSICVLTAPFFERPEVAHLVRKLPSIDISTNRFM